MEPTRRNSLSQGKVSNLAIQCPSKIRSPASSQCYTSPIPSSVRKPIVRQKNNEENESPKVPRLPPTPTLKPSELPPSGKNLRSVTSFPTCHVRRTEATAASASICSRNSAPSAEPAKAKNVSLTRLAWPSSPMRSGTTQTPRTRGMKFAHHTCSGETIGRSASAGTTPSVTVQMNETTRHVAKAKSLPGSSSAWALSPGRSITPLTPTKPASPGGMKNKPGKVSSILSLFRPRKTFSEKEDNVHQLRILQTRLTQWRFINARTQVVVARRTLAAEKQLLKAWVRISSQRDSAARVAMEVQRLVYEIKLNSILKFQISYLEKWEKMEKKHLEAACRTARRLQAAVLRVPIVDGAKGDTSSILAATYAAMTVMDRVQLTVGQFFAKTSSMSLWIAELVKVTSQERSSLAELKDLLSTMVMLEAQENSLRAHLVGVYKERCVSIDTRGYN